MTIHPSQVAPEWDCLRLTAQERPRRAQRPSRAEAGWDVAAAHVCGGCEAKVSPASRYRREVNGHRVLFCSPDCRHRFMHSGHPDGRNPRTLGLVTVLTLLGVGMAYFVGATAAPADTRLRDISTQADWCSTSLARQELKRAVTAPGFGPGVKGLRVQPYAWRARSPNGTPCRSRERDRRER